MLGMEGRRYKLWWCGKGDGVGGVRVMVFTGGEMERAGC